MSALEWLEAHEFIVVKLSGELFSVYRYGEAWECISAAELKRLAQREGWEE